MSNPIIADVLRKVGVKTEYTGAFLRNRMLGIVSDTGGLAYRYNDVYKFVENYDDAELRELIGGKADDNHNHVMDDVNGLLDALNAKQDTLTAGDNITISGDVISAVQYDDTELQEAVSELQQYTEALQGAMRFIGNIALPSTQVTQSALNSRAQELNRFPAEHGYVLVDADNNDWWYDGEVGEWVDIGGSVVSTATNSSLGIVKGSTENGKVSVALNGEMTANGLKYLLDFTANRSFYATPSVGSGTPQWRGLVAADLPHASASSWGAVMTRLHFGLSANQMSDERLVPTAGAVKTYIEELVTNINNDISQIVDELSEKLDKPGETFYNCNIVTTTGIYTNGGYVINTPSGFSTSRSGEILLFCVAYGSAIMQTITYSASGAGIWTRYRNSSSSTISWSAWESTSTALKTTGGTLTGRLTISNDQRIEFSNTVEPVRELFRAEMSGDVARVAVGLHAPDEGYLEIATGDNGNEPIYVRQYANWFTGQPKRTLVLLSENGDTELPGHLYLGDKTVATERNVTEGRKSTSMSPDGCYLDTATTYPYGHQETSFRIIPYVSGSTYKLQAQYRIRTRSGSNGVWSAWSGWTTLSNPF